MKKNLILLICFVHKKKLLDKILAQVMDLGIGGATVLDSTGIGRFEAENSVLYEGFKDVLRGAQKDHYTVLCIMKKSKIKNVSEKLKILYGNFEEHGIGFFFTVPVDETWGIHL